MINNIISFSINNKLYGIFVFSNQSLECHIQNRQPNLGLISGIFVKKQGREGNNVPPSMNKNSLFERPVVLFSQISEIVPSKKLNHWNLVAKIISLLIIYLCVKHSIVWVHWINQKVSFWKLFQVAEHSYHASKVPLSRLHVELAVRVCVPARGRARLCRASRPLADLA